MGESAGFMQNEEMAKVLVACLDLGTAPIALAFAASEPSRIAKFEGSVPAACAFWRRAETSVFYATAEQHLNCPIGALTMGFDMPDSTQENLMQLVGKMCDCGYLSSDEPQNIPTIKKDKRGIVYGPLSIFPLQPDLILLWVTPRHAMLFGEAVGITTWSASQGKSLFGRPACSALPAAFENSHATLSLGCVGMRTFTMIEDDRLLAVLPGNKVDGLLADLQRAVQANKDMLPFYEDHKVAFS